MIYPILTTIYGENSAPLLFFCPASARFLQLRRRMARAKMRDGRLPLPNIRKDIWRKKTLAALPG
jgi:hypothetical protein